MTPSVFKKIAPGGRAGRVGAGISCDAGKFYCEIDVASGVGSFVARLSNGEEYRRSLDELRIEYDVADGRVDEPVSADSYLLKGIGWVLTKYKLSKSD